MGSILQLEKQKEEEEKEEVWKSAKHNLPA